MWALSSYYDMQSTDKEHVGVPIAICICIRYNIQKKFRKIWNTYADNFLEFTVIIITHYFLLHIINI